MIREITQNKAHAQIGSEKTTHVVCELCLSHHSHIPEKMLKIFSWSISFSWYDVSAVVFLYKFGTVSIPHTHQPFSEYFQ